MPELPKQYDPAQHEAEIYKRWEEAGAFKPFDRAQGKPFVIMMPPPNVTGALHMGHALEDTMMDVLTRFHRLLGEPTLWVPGTDHAALPTNALIEKQLKAEGLTKHDIGREEFMKRVVAWYEKFGGAIAEQIKRLGSSCDWSRYTFTMDERYVMAVQEAFVRYYERGYIYRGNRLVNWCPVCASVISDLEIQYEERNTTLVTLRYPLASGSGSIDVATVRPETMLGDTAVAVHPADERYRALIGQMVRLPVTGREVPIIADEGVDQTFGTGAVKVTPAHDAFDAELAARHQLPVIMVIGEDGRMTALAGEYDGLPATEARKKILQRLRHEDVVVDEQPYRHSVAICERSKNPIEPLLSRQWFVDMKKLKGWTKEAVEKDLIHFHGPRWKEHLLSWVANEHDWTISRQIWLGQQIPVWWKPGTRGTEQETGNFVVSRTKPAGDWQQDPDVLDTWFSSALWPLVTLGWPEATEDLKKYYPTSVLTTAREILYLWEHRMIFSGLELMQDEAYGKRSLAERIPFHDVIIHATVLTKDGQRMSKSLGTGIDPLDLITTYGADATRFGLLYQMSYDQQAIRFDEAQIKTARNFANKIWNLARLLQQLPAQEQPTSADMWITERLASVTAEVTQLLEMYRLGEAVRLLHQFIWDDFADWYVEILKVRGSTKTAHSVFKQILTLLHPFMPFVTEVLWPQFGESELLITSTWPQVTSDAAVAQAAVAVNQFKELVTTVRRARVLLEVPPRERVTVQLPDLLGELIGAFEALSISTVTQEITSTAKRFPTPSGNFILLQSVSITPASIAKAQAKLAQALQHEEQFIARQEKIVAAMQGKAEAAALETKKAELAAARLRQAELARSLEALKGVEKDR